MDELNVECLLHIMLLNRRHSCGIVLGVASCSVCELCVPHGPGVSLIYGHVSTAPRSIGLLDVGATATTLSRQLTRHIQRLTDLLWVSNRLQVRFSDISRSLLVLFQPNFGKFWRPTLFLLIWSVQKISKRKALAIDW